MGRSYKGTIRSAFGEQYRKSLEMILVSPTVQLTIDSLLVLVGMCFIYLAWYYKNAIVDLSHNLPELVAKIIRKSLSYSSDKYLDIRKACRCVR